MEMSTLRVPVQEVLRLPLRRLPLSLSVLAGICSTAFQLST